MMELSRSVTTSLRSKAGFYPLQSPGIWLWGPQTYSVPALLIFWQTQSCWLVLWQSQSLPPPSTRLFVLLGSSHLALWTEEESWGNTAEVIADGYSSRGEARMSQQQGTPLNCSHSPLPPFDFSWLRWTRHLISVALYRNTKMPNV